MGTFCTKTKFSGEMVDLLVEGVYWFLQNLLLENIKKYPQSLQLHQLFLGRVSILRQDLHQQYLLHQGYAATRFNSGVG